MSGRVLPGPGRAGKAIEVFCRFGKLDLVRETLPPHRMYLQVR